MFMNIEAAMWRISTFKNNMQVLHIISPIIQFREIKKGFCISKWQLEMCSCIAWGDSRRWGTSESQRRDNCSCAASLLLTVVSFGTWQGWLLPEGNALALTDKGGWATIGLLDVLFTSEVFKSFGEWCLN